MNDELEGIVLSQREYRENDVLLSVFSKDYGKMTLTAKGVLKSNSRNQAIVAPYACSCFQLDYDPLKTMFLLKTGTVVASNYKIREKLEAMNAAALLCEITERIIQAQEPAEVLYDELSFSLALLHQGEDVKLVVSYFIAQVLKEMGLEPNVDECVLCSNQAINTISIIEGGFVCKECASQTQVLPVDLDALKMFRYINKAQQENFEALKKLLKLRISDVKIFVDFFILHSGLTLESWRFFMECSS